LRKVLLEGAELYRQEADREETLSRYGRGTPEDWLERHIYTRRSLWGVFLMLAVNLLLLGPIGISVWAVQMIWIPLWAAGVINGVGHSIGYRTFATADASVNIVPWGILIGGEELHNNHHAYPGSAKLSARSWEFDIGWLYIRILELLHLATVKKTAPPPAIVTRNGLDVEAVRAIVTARFQVLARYGREVLARVHKDELRRSDSRKRVVLKAVRRALRWDDSLLDTLAREDLRKAMECSPTLRTAYQFRERLQEIWQQPAMTAPENTLKSLQEWCCQAEASGIQALKDFAVHLGGYRLHGPST
jgi:stearoyl-CoA desaturase (delta-9 desaturase)